MSQQSLKNLALAIAQEAVCVNRVLITVEMQSYHVSDVLNLILSLKCDLGGCSTEIQSSHCGPAGAKPAPHKTVLQINNKAEVNGRLLVHFYKSSLRGVVLERLARIFVLVFLSAVDDDKTF